MKWSLCSTGNRDKPVEYVLNRVQELGLAGIELWTGHIDEYAERNGSIDGLIEDIRGAGWGVPAISPYTVFSKTDEERQESLAVVDQAARYAAAFGSPLVRVFAGHLPSREASGEMWSVTIDALRQAAGIAAAHGVKLGLEMHNNTFADRPESIERIMKEVNDPALRLIFDGFNLYLDRIDQNDVLEPMYGYTDHVHMKSYWWKLDEPEKRKATHAFDGDVDNGTLCRKLRDKGYDGFVSLEYFGEEGERAVRETVAELKKLGWM